MNERKDAIRDARTLGVRRNHSCADSGEQLF